MTRCLLRDTVLTKIFAPVNVRYIIDHSILSNSKQNPLFTVHKSLQLLIFKTFDTAYLQAVMKPECPEYQQPRMKYDVCDNKCSSYASEYVVYPLAFAVLVTMLTLHAFTCRQIHNCHRLHRHNGHQFQRLVCSFEFLFI
jgi:hypothetical protein